jgi:hypothetical protein
LTKKNLKFFLPFLLTVALSLFAWWLFHISRKTIQQAVDVPVRVEKNFNPNVYDVAPANSPPQSPKN